MKSKSAKRPKEHALIVEWGGLTAGAYGRPAGGVGAAVNCIWLDCAQICLAGEGIDCDFNPLARDRSSLIQKAGLRRIRDMETISPNLPRYP